MVLDSLLELCGLGRWSPRASQVIRRGQGVACRGARLCAPTVPAIQMGAANGALTVARDSGGAGGAEGSPSFRVGWALGIMAPPGRRVAWLPRSWPLWAGPGRRGWAWLYVSLPPATPS